MAIASVADTIARASIAIDLKHNWVSQYRDAYEYGLPMRDLYSTMQPGADKMDRVFDSTAINSTQKFASRLQSNLTPPFQEWLDFLPGVDVPEDQMEEATKKLQTIQKQFFSVIQNSNFDTSAVEGYLDLAVGTMAMLVLEGDDENPVIFNAIPNAQIALDEGPLGSVDGVFREHSVPLRNVDATWPDVTTEGKAAIQKMIKDGGGEMKNNARANILEATYFDHKEKVFWYQVILKGALDNQTTSPPTGSQSLDQGSGNVLLVERKLKESPWVITRWVKVAGEVFGRGPLLFALPDIKTLNKTVEFMLQNASMSINGLWQTSNDSIANLDMVKLEAGTFFPVDKIGDIERMDTPGDLKIGEAISEKLKEDIKTALFDRGLPDPTGSVRSPTEIIERVKELSQDIGAPFSRIMSEFLRPLAQRTLNIMERRGLIDFPIKLDGRATKVQATSPLAKEQALNDLESVVNWITINQSVSPEILFGGIKVEDLPAWSGSKLGVPQELIRDESEREKLQETVAQLIAQVQLAEQGAQAP